MWLIKMRKEVECDKDGKRWRSGTIRMRREGSDDKDGKKRRR